MRTFRSTLIATISLATLMLGIAPAQAMPAQDDDGPGSLMLVMDASGSMAEALPGGGTRIDAAKAALHSLLDDLPESHEVGMRVFGATVPTSAGVEESCRDSQLVSPVGSDNRQQMREAVDEYEPMGHTPIGYALQQAGADLGSEGRRSIVLVSDGLANCEPDPCVVAADLAADDISVRIDVIGFEVDDTARQQLQCIAAAGSGDYYDAADTDTLSETLTRLALRAFRPFSIEGIPVEGTPSAADAPVLTPGAQYTDRVESGREHHYRIPRSAEGSKILVGGAAVLPSGAIVQGLHLQLFAGDSRCDGSTAVAAIEGGLLSTRVSSGSQGDACSTSDEVMLVITQPSPGDEPPFNIELRVIEQPLPANAEALPPQEGVADGWALSIPRDGADGEAIGGSSFNDPTPVVDGSYRTEILPGETLTFAVDVDWGQSVIAHAVAGEGAYDSGSQMLWLSIHDPLGGDVDSRTRPAELMGHVGHGDAHVGVAAVTAPVRWTARPTVHERPDLAGTHTVTLGYRSPHSEPHMLPVVVTFEVVGEPSGIPEFPSDAGAPEPDQESATADGSQAPTPDAPDAAEPSPLDVLQTAALVITGIILIAGGGLGLWLWRRSRTTP